MSNKKYYQQGQGLIEVLAALSIAMVVLTALTVASVSSVRNATFARNQSISNQYAREGLDIVRAIRDSTKATFFGLSTNCKIFSTVPVSASYPLGYSLVDKGGTCGTNGTGGENVNSTGFLREIDLGSTNSCPAPSPLPSGYNASTGLSCRKVTVYVWWTDGTGAHKSVATNNFGEWQ